MMVDIYGNLFLLFQHTAASPSAMALEEEDPMASLCFLCSSLLLLQHVVASPFASPSTRLLWHTTVSPSTMVVSYCILVFTASFSFTCGCVSSAFLLPWQYFQKSWI
ncbi:hypothetical protein HN873_072573 [Arachis hypogaea]|nr:uncharacterized protein DS421_20g709070 [Arachis hypogaea]